MEYAEERIVKVKEEQCEDVCLRVYVPENKVDCWQRDFEMGAKYAKLWLPEAEDKENYDEYFDEMADYREGTSGEDTFIYYLQTLGYTVEYVKEDFEFEW